MSNSDEVHIKDHLTLLVEERFNRILAILDEREKALNLTASNLHEKLVQMNALREELVRVESKFVTRDTFDDFREVCSKDISELKLFQSKLLGVGIVFGVLAGVVGAVIAHVFIR